MVNISHYNVSFTKVICTELLLLNNMFWHCKIEYGQVIFNKVQFIRVGSITNGG